MNWEGEGYTRKSIFSDLDVSCQIFTIIYMERKAEGLISSKNETCRLPRSSYLDAMKGVMSSSRGKETYVVIFLRSLAECSNRWRGPERVDEKGDGKRRRGKRERRGVGKPILYV